MGPCFVFSDSEIRMNVDHVQSYRHFCNKIWQAFKLVSSQLGDSFTPVTHVNVSN